MSLKIILLAVAGETGAVENFHWMQPLKPKVRKS
jgi:hypothetical protein